MSTSDRVIKFDDLIKSLNKIIFGNENENVVLDGVTKPTWSKWLKSKSSIIDNKADKSYVDNALSQFQSGSSKFYATLADANANIANIMPKLTTDTVKDLVNIGEVGNGGLWYKATAEATSLTKSAYDPLLQSAEYVDVRVGFGKNTNKFFEFVDANGVPILSIFKNLSVWIPDLKKDIASSINLLNPLLSYLYSEEGGDLILFRDSSGVPFFRISKNLDVDIGKYRINKIADDITNVSALVHLKNGSDLLSIVDSNDLPVIRLLQNQDLLIPKIGNLTKTLLTLKGKIDKGIGISSSGGGSEGADLVLATLNEKQSSGTLSALTASMINNLNIFPHSVNLIRIPAITRIQKNKFLCFFEARVDGDDFGRNSQGVCTLTVDTDSFTITADNIQSLHAAEPHATVVGAFYTFMNACAVKLDSGRIIALYVKRYGTGEHYIYKRYSDNDGATWSKYEDIGTQLNMGFYNLLCPCSQGLVKRYGSFKGRIIFPVWYSGRTYNFQEFRAGYIYSDDQGETWHDGAFNSESRSNEVQCAEDMNGDVLFCIRREIVGDNAKTWAKLYDGDFELTPFKSKRIINVTHVMSGLIQARNNFDLSIPKFQYIGTYSAGRRNLKIFTSYDAGLNWVNEYDVPNTSNGSVYSCIERLDEYYTFALWETPGVNEFKCQILALNDLITNK